MPQMIDFVFNVLPSRYQSALDTYDSMKEEGYVLTLIKINPAKEEINSLFESVKQAFYELRYMEVKDEIKTLTYKINDLNVLLTTEKDSREDFEENNDRIYAFIDEVNKKFLKAKRDFYSINGVYLIDKSKEDELIFIENELASLSRAKIELNNYIHAPTKSPYSLLNTKLVDITDFSDSINSKVESFQSYIYSLKEDSNYAYKYVNDASVAVTYYYDLILGLHHRALESTYKDRYEEVGRLIDLINKELMTKPIYVEKINGELREFKTKATSLLKDMKESIKLHNNASNIIVYTNKYRSSFHVVNEVLNSAQVHFENGEFEFAIDRVSEILQQVHPKAYEDMAKYRNEVNE
jgi:septation ring formation regulator EzrA